MIQSGMRILFIGPKTFSYETEIKLELERAGCHVDWYDDRHASTPLVKALIRFRPELIATMSDAYFDGIINQAKSCKYDVVFIIKGEAISAERLAALRQSQTGARFLYYTWDSLKNFKNGSVKLCYFEKAYSFDRFDSISNPTVRHLPLFYLDAYSKIHSDIAESHVERDIDLLFLGSIHSDRHAVVQHISDAAIRNSNDLSLYSHFYYQSQWVFALRKLFDHNFRTIPWRDVQWQSLDKEKTLALYARSKIILDIHHPGQTGLTMRTIECLGAGKKMITTNPDVVNYEFYRSENILVVDRISPKVPPKFLYEPYLNLPDKIYQRYSLKSWLNQIFS